MSVEWINRLLKILALIVGLLSGGATAVNIAATAAQNIHAEQGPVMGDATAENWPIIAGQGTLAGVMGLLFANSKKISEFVTKATGSEVAGGAVYAIGVVEFKRQWQATKSAKARNAIRAAVVEIIGSEVFPEMTVDAPAAEKGGVV